jgi:hypothetical protein
MVDLRTTMCDVVLKSSSEQGSIEGDGLIAGDPAPIMKGAFASDCPPR